MALDISLPNSVLEQVAAEPNPPPVTASSFAVPDPPISSRGKVRSSCDRCHTQKLRCLKRPEHASCERCMRLRCPCRYSPRASRVAQMPRRPSKHSGTVQDTVPPVSASALLEEVDGRPFGGLDIDWSLYQSQNEQLFDPYNGLTPNFAYVEDKPTTALSAAVRRLATLHVDTLDCLGSFPVIDISEDGTIAPAELGTCASKVSTQFSFDELFRLTTEFVEILEALHAIPTQRMHGPMRIFSDDMDFARSSVLSQPLPDHGAAAAQKGMITSMRPWSHVDEATVLLVASCHSRLLQLYSGVIQRMQMCIEHSLRPGSGSDWKVVLPKVQVGSLSLPPLQVDQDSPAPSKATSSMYMVMITTLSTQLWERVGLLLRTGDGCASGVMDWSEANASELAWCNMKDGTDNLKHEITRIQHLLQ